MRRLGLVGIAFAPRRLGLVAAALATLVPAGSASAQAVRGRVLDEDTGEPVTGVEIQLLNDAGTRIGVAITDSIGAFFIAGRGPGDYSLRLSHIAYEDYRSPEFTLPYMETAVMDVRVARSVIPLEPITVHSHLRTNYHAPNYDGLYARMRQLGTFGPNRVIMKDDIEMRSTMRVRDLLRAYFPTMGRSDIGRGCNPDIYWHGFLIMNSAIADLRMDTSVEDLEAIEVYDDFLMAPMQFRESRILGSQPCGVVALWPLRPDLPGRKGG